jgi:murein DD-endopeptidase MepM/ murein hydrolase activator NlpD
LRIRHHLRVLASSRARGFVRTIVVSSAVGLVVALSTGPCLADPAVPAARGALSQDPATLGAELQAAQVKVFQLNDQIRQAEGKLGDANRTLEADRGREADLQAKLGTLARLQYEQPTFTLSSVLQAPTLGRLLDKIALSRVVVGKQQALLDQMEQVRERDQKARDDVAKEVDRLKALRVEASQAAQTALGLRSAVTDILLSQAKPGDPFAGACQPIMEQGFGPTSLYFEPTMLGFLHFHTGIDLSCPEGTPIHSVTDGIAHVTYGWGGGFGNNVVIESTGTSPLNSAPSTYFVRYGHMLPDITVHEGAAVHAGDIIGHLGSSGASTGPHLHFEIDVGANDINHAVDPSVLLTVH